MIKNKNGIEFQHEIKVDESHTIYFTNEVKDYYLRLRCDNEGIKVDVKEMLQDDNISDYEEVYLYFKDGELKVITEEPRMRVIVNGIKILLNPNKDYCIVGESNDEVAYVYEFNRCEDMESVDAEPNIVHTIHR